MFVYNLTFGPFTIDRLIVLAQNGNIAKKFGTWFALIILVLVSLEGLNVKTDKVFIKERMTKGKFAGGAVSFKLEAAIQLIDHLDVGLLTPAKIKAALSEHPIPVLFSETGLKVFQEAAFTVAYVGHMSHEA